MPPAAKTSRPDPKLASLAAQLLGIVNDLCLPGDRTGVDDVLTTMHQAGLTTAQLIALHALRHEGVHSVSELADKAGLSLPATSHLVDRLVAMGLVVRVEDERDRRHKQVSLGSRGAALIDRFTRARTSRVAAGLAALSASTRTRLAAALRGVEDELAARARSASDDRER